MLHARTLHARTLHLSELHPHCTALYVAIRIRCSVRPLLYDCSFPVSFVLMPDFATLRTRLAMVGALVLLLGAILFALQNTQPIRVNLLFASAEGSAALVLVCTFIIGVVVGVLALVPARLRDRRHIKELQKEQSQKEQDSQDQSSKGETPGSQSPTSPNVPPK